MVVDLLVFFVILTVVVLVHEWGHFFAARWFGIKVEEFGFGLPPRAKKLFIKKGTLYSLNWLPIGGFVRLKGESADGLLEGDDVFYRKTVWKRAVILVAGVVMNFLLAVFLFGGIYSYLGIPTETENVRIVEVVEKSPAGEAGIKLEDKVESIGLLNDAGELIEEIEVVGTGQLVDLINEHKGERVELLLIDEIGGSRRVRLVPRLDPPADEGSLGVALSSVELIHYPLWQMPFRGVVVGMKEALAWGREILLGLWSIISGIFAGEGVPEGVSGPVGIYNLSSRIYKIGWLASFQFVGVLSVNLAILNILPFPALDGGRLLFLGIEKIVGRRIKDRIEGTVHAIGMVFLLVLMGLITIRDVVRLF